MEKDSRTGLGGIGIIFGQNYTYILLCPSNVTEAEFKTTELQQDECWLLLVLQGSRAERCENVCSCEQRTLHMVKAVHSVKCRVYEMQLKKKKKKKIALIHLAL